MGNPFEFREIMKAAFRVNETRSVEEVSAEQEARRKARQVEDEAERQRNRLKPFGEQKPSTESVTPKMAPVLPTNKIDDLRALFAQAAAVQAESASIPDDE